MKKGFNILRNKYLLTIVGLSIWIAFFDKNDFQTQLALKEDVKKLEEERDYYAAEIKQITSDISELNTNPETLEKFAREKYLMKKDEEDIFVIVEEE